MSEAVASPAAPRPYDLQRLGSTSGASGPQPRRSAAVARHFFFNRRSRVHPGGATPREARDSNGGARGGNRVPPKLAPRVDRDDVAAERAADELPGRLRL